jgi:hypothetical protein
VATANVRVVGDAQVTVAARAVEDRAEPPLTGQLAHEVFVTDIEPLAQDLVAVLVAMRAAADVPSGAS